MKFLHTSNGLLNIDLIEKVWASKERGDYYSSRAFMKGREAEILIRESLEDIEITAMPVVAASPGFFVIRCFEDPLAEFYIDKTPIVAWRIAKGTLAKPVTVDDETPSSNEIGNGILLPSGEIIAPYDARFDNEKEWINRMVIDAEARKPHAT